MGLLHALEECDAGLIAYIPLFISFFLFPAVQPSAVLPNGLLLGPAIFQFVDTPCIAAVRVYLISISYISVIRIRLFEGIF